MSGQARFEPGPPIRQPLVGRQRHLILALRSGAVLAGLLAVVGLAAPGDAGRGASQGFLAVMIATPLLRVAWLTVRWVDRRDLRFAAVGAGVLALAGVAALGAW